MLGERYIQFLSLQKKDPFLGVDFFLDFYKVNKNNTYVSLHFVRGGYFALLWVDTRGLSPNVSTIRRNMGMLFVDQNNTRYQVVKYYEFKRRFSNSGYVTLVIYDLGANGGYKYPSSLRSGKDFKNLRNSVTFTDLEKTYSLFTRGKMRERRRGGQTPRTSTVRVDVDFDIKNDVVKYVFLVDATRDEREVKKEVFPDKTFRLDENPARVYELTFVFYTLFLSYLILLEDLDVDSVLQSIKNMPYPNKDLNLIFTTVPIKIFSTSPSFHYQGFNYNLSVLDGSVYPTEIAPQQWDKVHGVAFVDKHIGAMLNDKDFFLNKLVRPFRMFCKKNSAKIVENFFEESRK